MRTVTAPPGPPGSPGRWVWVLSGVITICALAIAAVTALGGGGIAIRAGAQAVETRTLTAPRAVTSVAVHSAVAPVVVVVGAVPRVQVTETVTYDGLGGGPPPALTESVSGGRLTLSAAACAVAGCVVGLTVTVPAPVNVSVTVTGDGGAVATARATEIHVP